MASAPRIGIRQVKALTLGTVLWDGALPGFGIRRQKGAAVTYVLLYRNAQGRQRWFTIGKHGAPWTPETARKRATELLGEVSKGIDPSGNKIARREAMTVSELCDDYLAAAKNGHLLKATGTVKKASTLMIDIGRIERHIKPLIGKIPVSGVMPDDIDRLLHDIADGKIAARIKTKPRGLAVVKGGKATANRTTGLLGAIFTYAVRRRLVSQNPVHGLRRFADNKRERRLSPNEYASLGEALTRAQEQQALWPPAIAAARFLALTGWRKGEVLGLKWAEIDLTRHTARLGDTKTGQSIRPMSLLACELAHAQPRLNSSPFVFPNPNGMPMTGYRKSWARIGKLANLPAEVTPHILRHSFASVAVDLGYSELTIAALIGHRKGTVTSRYAHHADTVLLAAADQVAKEIEARMNGENANLADSNIVSFKKTA